MPPAIFPPAGDPNLVVRASQLVDLLNPNVPYSFDFPLVSGKRLVGLAGKFVVSSISGTATGACSYSVGNNAVSYNNFQTITSGISAATFNASSAHSVISLGAGNSAPDMTSNQLQVMVTTSPTGLTAIKGYFVFLCVYG